MMKVALIGYGKMGKAIEQILLERGHEVRAKIDSSNKDAIDRLDGTCDVAIEFSRPEAAMENFKKLIQQNIAVVTGTTGWYASFDTLKALVEEHRAAFFYASNFSLGVNLFFELNRKLARLMADYPEYKVSIEEIHHTQKLDAPSGTAITLAEGLLENYPALHSWALDSKTEGVLPIEAKRLPDVPGTHAIQYRSAIDTIEIKHTAHSRQGFALGAVLAAEFMKGKKGIYSMKDLLKTSEN